MPVHGRQLALFTCGVTGKLRPLDFDLVPDQFVVGLHRHQFPAAMENAPARSPATPARRTALPPVLAPATPRTSEMFVSNPSPESEDGRSGCATLHVAVTAATNGTRPEQSAQP